jgi:Phytoene dehydrogenase and related proteins
LNLKTFRPGALVRYLGQFHRVLDPFREPIQAVATVCNPIGTIADKLNIARLRIDLSLAAVDDILSAQEVSTLDCLRARGFSQSIIERFFRPFFGGIFLEKELATSSRKFDFLFRMFSSGDTAIPALGMQELPRQLAARLAAGSIKFNARAKSLSDQTVNLENGETLEAPHIVVATDGIAANRLLYETESIGPERSVSCLYYATDKPPLNEPILVLNGDGDGPINNLCIPSAVSPTYAPAGQSLVSVSVIDAKTGGNDESLEQSVRQQLKDWYGESVESWRHLRTYRIPNALPQKNPPTQFHGTHRYVVRPGVYVCGDHMSTGSINGALESGRAVGQLITSRVRSESGVAS